MKNILILVLVFAFCSCNFSSKKATSEGKNTKNSDAVHTTIATNKSVYKKSEPIELSLEVKNTGSKPFTFLPWGTPIENKFTGACLQVTHKNKDVDYIGIMVKRMPPTKKDSVNLKTGETTVGKVNLLDGYKLIEKGVYTIRFKETYGGLPASNTINVEIK